MKGLQFHLKRSKQAEEQILFDQEGNRLMMVAPVLVLFVFAQRYFVQGIAQTGFGGR